MKKTKKNNKKKVIRLDKTNHRWWRFALEYCLDGNRKRAYRCIYPKCSEDAAEAAASRLLRNVKVRQYVESRQAILRARLAQKLELSAEETLRAAANIMRSNMKNVATWSNKTIKLKSSEELTDNIAATISQIQKTKDGIKIKLHSPVPAIGKIGEYFKLWDGEKSPPGAEDEFPVISIPPNDKK